MAIHTKRIYEDAQESDGTRILVDRIWPRGISKEDAHLDDWLKDIAPSTELRKWFNHETDRYDEFAARYSKELAEHTDLVDALKEKAKQGTLTLLYGAKDTEHNQAVALKEFLEQKS